MSYFDHFNWLSTLRKMRSKWHIILALVWMLCVFAYVLMLPRSLETAILGGFCFGLGWYLGPLITWMLIAPIRRLLAKKH